MCRLFGFRSVIPSQVHRSLLDAENALGRQSNAHPDGWGVAYYLQDTPHVTKSASRALGDALFHRLSGVVASETVVAHVRKATVGDISVLNCHPFQFGRWIFAHNGEIPGFAEQREKFLGEIDPALRRYVLGDTDSEVIFHLLLTELNRFAKPTSVVTLGDCIRRTIDTVQRLWEAPDSTSKLLLTVMITNGSSMLAYRFGKELHYSTYKTRCSDRDSCASLSPECEAPSLSGRVNHMIISSEPLLGENVWHELPDQELIGVDESMMLVAKPSQQNKLPVLA
ncbi:MAG: class II glutamine amidotransferase [Myxococcales bacterium]|nr:MAG: class II glutamine amidotransferase [Myxococcales bacterium]